MGMCNCAVCLKKRKLAHLIGDRFGKPNSERLPGETVQAFIDRMIQQKAPAPFDRVRLVTKADDIQSPPLPEEWQVYIAKQTNPHFVDLRPKRPGNRKRRSESTKDTGSKKGSANDGRGCGPYGHTNRGRNSGGDSCHGGSVFLAAS